MPRIETSPETHRIEGNPRCPLCAQNANVGIRIGSNDVFEGWCARCSNVRITQAAVEEARGLNKTHLISVWFRRLSPDDEVGTLKRSDVARIIKDTPQYSVLEKLDLALEVISSTTREPGQKARFSVRDDYPLMYSASEQEAVFYVKQLAELGYIKEEACLATITAKGYQRIVEMQRAGRTSAFVFVAMSFDLSMNAVYDEAIEPAVRKAGYKPVRVDRTEHVNRIDDEIIGRIRGSRFMIADFTGQRPGVYFEAGLMMGLGRNVIWMCKKEDLKNVHFDTRQYNFIVYEDVSGSNKRLYDRIIAIEGEGPESKGVQQ
jgi:hypothetical protein